MSVSTGEGLLAKNVLANFLGTGWLVLLNLAFVPVYSRLLGIEAFGLVGLFLALQSAIPLLDLGLSPTVNREAARLATADGSSRIELRNLSRTLEILYWAAAVLLIAAGPIIARVLATTWIHPVHLARATVTAALRLLVWSAAVQLPLSFYSAALRGLHRQVLLNVLLAATSALRFAGAAAVLWTFSSTVTAFFWWQVAATAIQSLIAAVALWACLPAGPRPRFQAASLRKIRNFAIGTSGIALVTLALTQVDKVILSKVLSLPSFGYYSLALVVAAGVSAIAGPLFNAFFPVLSSRVFRDDGTDLAALYHLGCQTLATVVLPVAVVIALNSRAVIALWTRDQNTAQATHRIVSVLVAAAALNGLLYLPYALQLAVGWTRLAFWFNFAAVAVLAPLIILFAPTHGPIVAAYGLFGVSLAGLCIAVPIMHIRILRGHLGRWLRQDVISPLIVSLTIGTALHLLVPTSLPNGALALVLAGMVIATFIAAAASAPLTRAWAIRFLSRRGDAS